MKKHNINKMKEIVPQEVIQQRIFLIRRQKVMLDRDLAYLYGVETRVLNQAIRRNIERFPDDFMFSLTRQEIMNLSQIVIGSKIKHSPNVFAFTEQGVAMLSSVLRSKRAIQVNIVIMRTFVKIRKILSNHKELADKLSQLERKIEKHNGEIKAIFDVIHQLMLPPEKPQRRIGFRTDEKTK